MHISAARFAAFLLAVALTAVVAEFFLYDGAHVRVAVPMVASAATPENTPSHAS